MNNLRERKSCVSQKEGLSAKLDELAGEPAAGFACPGDRSAGVHARGCKGADSRRKLIPNPDSLVSTYKRMQLRWTLTYRNR